MNNRRTDPSQIAAMLSLWIFVLAGVVLGIVNLTQGVTGRGLLGLGALFFLVIPPVVRLFVPEHPHRLYTLVFSFCILAYDIGCVAQRFDAWPYFDKLSHFLSGIVFTVLGFCVYLAIAETHPLDRRVLLSATYALFFSTFVAVAWEVGEFTGFLLTGHDSQHTLTTGVFDTMEDLIACLAGSLLSVAGFCLYARKGIRLVTGPVVAEVHGLLEMRRAGPAEKNSRNRR